LSPADAVVGGLKEHDLSFEDIPVHCWEGGTGQPIVFLHGSGAGAATLSNFRRVLGPLAEDHHVLAADLVGFGQSGLRPARPYFDMDLWVRQLGMLLDHVGRPGAVVVGHSLSGAIALKAAATDPRIGGVVTTGTMGAAPADPRRGPRWRFPESRSEVQSAVERTFYDKSLAEPSEVDRRLTVLQRPGYRAYFEEMFAEPGAYYLRASTVTPDELARIQCPVLFMHGAHDASFAPEDTSLALARQIALADVYLLGWCAHSVAHERPREFIAAVRTLAERVASPATEPDGKAK
jgi:2-hydroxymuconate-semialdehyde hydrolase